MGGEGGGRSGHGERERNRSEAASIFLDIDDTLCKPGQEPTARTMEALLRCRSRGHRLFLCTARTLSAIPPSLVELEPDGVISAAGSHIISGNRIIYEQYIAYPLLETIVGELFRLGIPALLGTPERSLQIGRSPELLGDECLLEPTDFQRLGPYVQVSKLSFLLPDLAPHTDLQRLIAREFELIVYPGGYGEATLGDSNKGLGVRILMDALGLPFARSYAIGDNLPDISMFRSVETGIAMGNAAAAVKEAADYVTLDIDGEGVRHALEHFGLIAADV